MNYQHIIAQEAGGPEVLHLVNSILPEPSSGQVIVRVLAAGVSFADVLVREGIYPGMPPFPITPGYDLVGTVEAVGSSVQGLHVSDRVAALTVTRGYTEAILLEEEDLVPVPAGVDPVEAVALVLNYVTAYQMLHRAVSLQPGDTILVHGAAGGVGTALLQLGSLMGLRVLGTASASKHETVKSMGGIPIEYREGDVAAAVRSLAPDGLHAAFDATGQWLAMSYRLLRSDGRLVVYGSSSMLHRGRRSLRHRLAAYGRMLIFLRNLLPVRRRVSLYQITAYRKRHPEWFREDLLHLFGLLQTGQVKPLIASVHPLAEAALCHRALNESNVTGKMVLRMNT